MTKHIDDFDITNPPVRLKQTEPKGWNRSVCRACDTFISWQ